MSGGIHWPGVFRELKTERVELIAALIALGVEEAVLPLSENHQLRMLLRTELALWLIEPNPAAVALLEAVQIELRAPPWFVEERRESAAKQKAGGNNDPS